MRASLCLLLASCTSETICELPADSIEGQASVQIGHGLSEYQPLGEEVGEIEVVLGPQGGFMLPMAIEARGMVPGNVCDDSDPDNPRVTYQARLADSEIELGQAFRDRGLIEEEPGVFRLIGTWFVISLDLRSEDFVDQEVIMETSLTDMRGVTVSDEARFIIRMPADS